MNISPMKKIIGFGCLILSMVLSLIIFALPFIDAEAETKVAVGGGLYVASYAVMFVGGAVLGREIMDEMKKRWKSWFQRKSKSGPESDREE